MSHHIYAHRAIPSVLVQEIRLSNPTAHDVRFKVRILEYFTLSVKSVKTVAVNLGKLVSHGAEFDNHLVQKHKFVRLKVSFSDLKVIANRLLRITTSLGIQAITLLMTFRRILHNCHNTLARANSLTNHKGSQT